MWKEYRRKTGLVVVLSGPSGVGKDSVLVEFLRICPDITKCVTYTTRPQRQGERPGEDYHFVSVRQFREMVEAGQFLEWAEVHGNLYGTPRPWVEDNTRAGRDVILKIDVQGGIAVKRQVEDAVMVFLAPTSIPELEHRLRARLTEEEDEIMKRLLDAASELRQIPAYDYLVENDSVDRAAEQLRAIVIAERARIRRPL